MAIHLFAASILGLANAQAALPTTSQYEGLHQAVYDTILQSYNGRPTTSVVELANMIEDGGQFCFPYPRCISDRAEIKAFLQNMHDSTTDMYMVASSTGDRGKKVVFDGNGGWLDAGAVSYKLKGGSGNEDGCQILASEFWTWELNASAPFPGLISKLSVHFDEANRFNQITDCTKAAKTTARTLRGTLGQSYSSTTAPDLSTVLALGKPTPSESVQRAIRGTIEAHLHNMNAHLALPTSNPDFLTGWFDPWSGAQEKRGVKVPALIAPVGVYQTRSDVRQLIAKEVAENGLAYGSVRLVSPVSVAGNVGSVLAMYTDSVRSTGCLASHFQFMTVELDPELVASFTADAAKAEAPYQSSGGLLSMHVRYSKLDFMTERHHCESKNSAGKAE